jgi:regulator of ribosome biosynthesis
MPAIKGTKASTTKVVSARDIIPNLYKDESENDSEDEEEDDSEDDGSDDEESEEEESEESEEENREDLVDDLKYDVFNLTAYNYHELQGLNTKNREQIIKDSSTRTTQLLISKLFSCPTEITDIGPVALLPNENTNLPREKRIPEPKPETKWEKFAKEKGIMNKKRERMVFDEESQEYKPRFGYKRANNTLDDIPIVEVKHGGDPFADPWAAAREDKKGRIEKNQKNQAKNLFNANLLDSNKKGSGALNSKSYDSGKNAGIPVDMSGLKKGSKKILRGRDGVRQALQMAQISTASMGRFDESRKGEPEKKLSGRKRSLKDNMNTTGDQSDMRANLRIVHDKVDKKKRGVTNSLKAYEGIIPDAPENQFKKSKGKGQVYSSDNSSKKGGQSKQSSKGLTVNLPSKRGKK